MFGKNRRQAGTSWTNRAASGPILLTSGNGFYVREGYIAPGSYVGFSVFSMLSTDGVLNPDEFPLVMRAKAFPDGRSTVETSSTLIAADTDELQEFFKLRVKKAFRVGYFVEERD